jgi:hypothetical protein
VWDYCVNFNHPLILLPNWWKMIADIKLYSSLGMKGIMFEGDDVHRTADLEEMRAWVTNRLMWDATLDGAALVSEFLTGYYGGAYGARFWTSFCTGCH